MSQHSFSRFFGLLFLAAYFLLPSGVKGQHLEVREWPQGKVILTSGDTLSGSVVYHLNQELLQVKAADGTVSTFAPVNVSGFTVFNEQHRRFQTFRTLLWSRHPALPDYKTPAFFEVMTEGRYTLVTRESFAVRNQDPVPRYAAFGRYYEPYAAGNSRFNGQYSQVVAVKQFYVLTPGQEIKALRKPKKDLPGLFQDKADAMQDYMKNKNLSYHNSSDLIPVIRHFNRL